MSEQIDYEERLPRQPSEGALDWCVQTKFKSEYAIYRDTYYRDPLTGGDNRAKFLLDANACLKNARKTYYLVLVNLRRLKLINRTRSHAVGDMLIKLCHEELLRHS